MTDQDDVVSELHPRLWQKNKISLSLTVSHTSLSATKNSIRLKLFSVKKKKENNILAYYLAKRVSKL